MDKIFMEGLFLQASLIFALGAQNLFVLESGLKRQNPLAVSPTCFVCDLALIMLGVAETATLLDKFFQLKVLFGIVGIFFTLLHGWGKLNPSKVESVLHTWFLARSYGSSVVKPFMESPTRMRMVVSVSGVLLIVLAGKLSTEVYTWIQ